MEKTPGMAILLTNDSQKKLTLIKSEINGSSAASSLPLPEQINGGSTDGGYGTPASDTPYTAQWVYSPDSGGTQLTFNCSLSGPTGITITPSSSGAGAQHWLLGESPAMEDGLWVVRFTYAASKD